MRLVLDTNVVVAGLLWHGTLRRLANLTIDALPVVVLYRNRATYRGCHGIRA